jgi:SAM-dependent methyltransferase
VDELDRIRAEYARRATDARYREWYAPSNLANRLMEEERAQMLRYLLDAHRPNDRSHARVLDIGCGGGHALADMAQYGFQTARLFGIDLLPERLKNGKERNGELGLGCADAQRIPFADARFDFVMQFTMFTSILDGQVKQNIAREMLRVLKPSGAILWYDYRWNPTNRSARGIGAREIRTLFPQCRFDFRRVTLAPPLARWLAPRSRALCESLQRLALLRTHYLVFIQPAARRS